jgi:hypothetical protein
MRTTIYKWFFAWDMDKEEKWLNEMSAIGLQLVSVGYCKYIFEEGIPGEYCVRIELLNNLPGHPESKKYIGFIEETGAEYIGSVIRWVYFRRRSADGIFDLFSDIDSRIKHFNRLLTMLGIIGVLNLCNGLHTLIYYLESRLMIQFILGALCFLLGLLLTYGFIRIYLKNRKLKKERRLRE